MNRKSEQLHRVLRAGGVMLRRADGREVCVVAACHWCQVWLPWWLVTFDHVIPRGILGGSPHLENQVIACEACNAARNDALMQSEAGRLYNQVQAMLDKLARRIAELELGANR